MTHNIAIIPARGGSKRIPKKNIIDFDGKPMIAWTIEAAKKSNMFTKILVSTDCEDIANVSRDFGAEVPFLRQSFADDNSPVSLATISALKDAEDYWKIDFDCVAQLMPNCPLRNEKDIVSAVNIFKNENRDFQISCFKFEWMNPWWAFKLNDDSSHEYIFPDKVKKRSQDLDDLFCPTGSIWIALSEKLKNSKTFYGQGHKFQPMSWISATDIDNYEDLDFAKALKQAIK
jgi:N-acylneuraminate cytidylyltransferase